MVALLWFGIVITERCTSVVANHFDRKSSRAIPQAFSSDDSIWKWLTRRIGHPTQSTGRAHSKKFNSLICFTYAVHHITFVVGPKCSLIFLWIFQWVKYHFSLFVPNANLTYDKVLELAHAHVLCWTPSGHSCLEVSPIHWLRCQLLVRKMHTSWPRSHWPVPQLWLM